VDAERMEHVMARKELSVFRVFKLTQADGTRRFFTYQQTDSINTLAKWLIVQPLILSVLNFGS